MVFGQGGLDRHSLGGSARSGHPLKITGNNHPPKGRRENDVSAPEDDDEE